MSPSHVTLNLAGEFPVDGGSIAFAPALGVRYGAEGLLRIGAEAKYHSARSHGSLIPQIWFAFPHEITFKTGFAYGIGSSPESFGRLVLELEF